MADLQARIGRKVFPNKSWTRPGYERPAQVKSSPNHHNSWKNNRRSAGYDSDGSSSSSHDRSSSRQRSHSQKASIFSRLGLSNPESFEDGNGNEDMEGVEAENVEKSLLERVGTSPRVAHLVPDVNAVLYPRAFTSQEEDMKADSPRSENDIIVGAKGDSESSVRSGPIDKPTTPDHQRKTTLTDKVPNNTAQRDDGSERQSIRGPSRDTGQTTARVSHVPPAPSATPPSPTTVENKNPLPHPNTSDNPDTANLGTSRRSASEEGELSEPLYANGVRGLLAPLVLQNAGGRSSKTAAEPLSPGELPQILTSDDVSSFGGTMSNLGKELLAQAGRDTKGGSGSFSAPNDTLPSAPRAMRNASWEHLSASASSSTFADRKHDTAQSPFAISEAGLRCHDTILSPASGRYLPSLRYTPSPQRPELRHHESHSSTSRHPRSPSPTASIRRSSSTRDRPYDPYSHERLPHDTSLAAAPMADPSMHRPARRIDKTKGRHWDLRATTKDDSTMIDVNLPTTRLPGEEMTLQTEDEHVDLTMRDQDVPLHLLLGDHISHMLQVDGVLVLILALALVLALTRGHRLLSSHIIDIRRNSLLEELILLQFLGEELILMNKNNEMNIQCQSHKVLMANIPHPWKELDMTHMMHICKTVGINSNHNTQFPLMKERVNKLLNGICHAIMFLGYGLQSLACQK
ncbi:hypothetical protein NLJ89_g4641 [Agrocybe chaxingu]|uniref:Uncharacterized protein n=1 Tax=Agrocybe chaxingu TaxID=84603 RepID=A0A9W8K2P2_9AGAR|nr:hypothetical protein NLJ89_g4641 [Agrocybe chaxingu]